MHAWTGNAGMVIEERTRSLLLKCSDGVGNVCFSDLVVTVDITDRGLT
jgi:hypothetical protein